MLAAHRLEMLFVVDQAQELDSLLQDLSGSYPTWVFLNTLLGSQSLDCLSFDA